jgi:hypothetical protein
MDLSGAETISLIEPSAPQERTITVNLHYNIIVIKSNKPGIAPKAFIVPSFNGELTPDQKDAFISRERAKMEADAEANVSVAETAVTDTSGERVVVTDSPGGE